MKSDKKGDAARQGSQKEVQATSEKKFVGDSYRLGDVRSELRLPTDLYATLSRSAESAELRVKIVDMSPTGMGMEALEAVEPQSKVTIDLEEGTAFGEIRFCREKSPGLFFLGFHLEKYVGKQV